MVIPLILLGIICVSQFIIAIFVLLKNSKEPTNRLFAAFVGSTIIWLISNFFIDSVSSASVAQVLMNLTFFSSSALIYTLFLFCLYISGYRKRIKRSIFIALNIFGIFSVLISGSPLVVSGIEKQNGVSAPIFGALTPVFALFILGYFISGMVFLGLGYRKSKGLERTRLRFVLYSFFFTFLVAIITNFVLPVMIKDVSLVIYGPFATIILTAGISYSILRHRLFDVKMIVARSVAYVLLLASLGLIYGLGLFAASNFLLGGSSQGLSQVLLNMALALLLVFTFQPLRRFFERVTDKIFYRYKYDSQVLLNQVTQTLASEIILENILEKTLTMIAQAVRVNFGQYIIFDDNKVYKMEHYGRMPQKVITTSELKLLNQPMLVADELESGQRKDVKDSHDIRLSLTLRTKDEFVGFLLLGDKLSGDIYTTQDIELFQILANELAVAIVNAKAYEEIAQFNVTLQDKVDKATASLRIANKHLKELDQAKDEFISMASHQLRTPLTTIKGYISMLQEGDAGKMTKEQQEFLEYAFSGSERMVSLISDLLNVSRMSSGKFMIDRQPVDIAQMVSDEVRQLKSHADAKGLKLIWEPPAVKLPQAEVDENKTRQVVMNFIDNAVYYTKTGSVTVTLEHKDDAFEFRVVDTGIGVPPAAREKLFSKFYRAGNAQQVRPDGTGLGLYLAKRVIEDQGGKIIFESEEGKGSTFGFVLPIKAQAAAKAEAKSTTNVTVAT